MLPDDEQRRYAADRRAAAEPTEEEAAARREQQAFAEDARAFVASSFFRHIRRTDGTPTLMRDLGRNMTFGETMAAQVAVSDLLAYIERTADLPREQEHGRTAAVTRARRAQRR